MSRIWQEGFEDGLPNVGYLEGATTSQYVKDESFVFPRSMTLDSGRSIYSSRSLKFVYSADTGARYFVKTISPALSEIYSRIYFKSTGNVVYATTEIIRLVGVDGNILLSIVENTSPGSYAIKVRKAGSYSQVATVTMATSEWHKIEFYYKVNGSTGAYEVRVDDVTVISESSLNTGASNVSSLSIGHSLQNASVYYIDDLAINDTSGSLNNSWCGNGTIISLKPKGTGNKSQWDNSKGYAKGESGTTPTNIKITGHGLATNDVIYNKTRDAYRIITYVDADNFTVSSVTSQTTSDVILLYKNVATISATSGTSTSLVTIAGHTMQSGDVVVNTSRSNAIRKVIYVSGNNVYNTHGTTANGTLGSDVTSQSSGDSIKTFAFTPYAITNHWESVANQTDPSPKLSYIESSTGGDIDTFDMEELVADKGLPSGSTIVAVSHNTYAQEAGAGSQIKPVFRLSGTDYEGSAISLSGGTLQYQQIYETSPATSSAWSRSEIDALEAGIKLV